MENKLEDIYSKEEKEYLEKFKLMILHAGMISLWKVIIQNKNSWVLFEGGTVVIFSSKDVEKIKELNLKIEEEALRRMENHKIREDVAVAELIQPNLGYIINCGNDFILNFLPFPSEYGNRYNLIRIVVELQKIDKKNKKIIYIEQK